MRKKLRALKKPSKSQLQLFLYTNYFIFSMANILLLVVLSTFYLCIQSQIPNFPHGGGACSTEYDCSLGGICNTATNTCICDSWTTGSNCNYLNFAPATENNGLQIPNYHSWGGHALLNSTDNTYHGYFSFLCNHATLGQWTTASSIWHAVSDSSPVGPFNLSDMVAIPWSHNAMISQVPNTNEYVLYQIGDAQDPPNDWYPCYNSSEISDTYIPSSSGKETTTPSTFTTPSSLANKIGGYQFYVRSSSSFSGPWTPLNNNTPLTVDYSNSWLANGNSGGNPAPYFFENGTVLLYISGNPCPPGWGNISPGNNCIGVLRADTWQGPYTVANALPVTHPESEDPFVFRDKRGNFHLLTNVNNDHTRCAQGVPCGGHAWSTDGINFSNLTIGAFGPIFRYSNGTYSYNAYVERPQIIQDANNIPIAMYLGIGRSSYMDSATWAQYFCTDADLAQGICGPTIAPPPPPPVVVQYAYGNTGQCMATNTTFPCPGGWNSTCPLFLQPCNTSSGMTLTTLWNEHSNGNIESVFHAGACINIDCNSCSSHTVAKIIACDSSTAVAYSSNNNGQLGVNICSSMCLNYGVGPAVPPCKQGEEYLPNVQIQLDSCKNTDTQGWQRIVVNPPPMV